MSSTDAERRHPTEVPEVGTIDMKLEVVTLPVSDVDRAKSFYQSLGWRLDADFGAARRPGGAVHAAPLAVLDPLGKGITTAEPGSVERLELVVEDIDSARADLISRGVDVSEVYEQRPPGLEGRYQGARTPAGVVQRSGRQRLAAPGGHDATPRPRMGGLTWTSLDWRICCTRRPNITARMRRSPHRTTGGTGTRHTWTPARAEAPGGGRRRRRALHGGGQARRRESPLQ